MTFAVVYVPALDAPQPVATALPPEDVQLPSERRHDAPLAGLGGEPDRDREMVLRPW